MTTQIFYLVNSAIAEPIDKPKIWTLIATFGLIVIAGAANGLMDRISFHYNTIPDSWNQDFWNPQKSWRNKWKNGDHTQGEKFTFSSTFLVGFTDAWHLLKSLMLTALMLALTLNISIKITGNTWIDKAIVFITGRTLFGIGFYLLYR
jgi:hypothetical protein